MGAKYQTYNAPWENTLSLKGFTKLSASAAMTKCVQNTWHASLFTEIHTAIHEKCPFRPSRDSFLLLGWRYGSHLLFLWRQWYRKRSGCLWEPWGLVQLPPRSAQGLIGSYWGGAPLHVTVKWVLFWLIYGAWKIKVWRAHGNVSRGVFLAAIRPALGREGRLCRTCRHGQQNLVSHVRVSKVRAEIRGIPRTAEK